MIHVDDISLQAGLFRLDRVSLTVASGEYFVLMGLTGSGKSLLVKSICGLARPISGSINIDGRDVTSLEPRHRRIGFVPQDCGLFPHIDVAENITFTLRLQGHSKRESLARVESVIELLGIRPLLTRRTANLSGGERQKVSLARALANHPKLLILDEPVSALDEPTRRDVCMELRGVQRRLGVTTIHICHNMQEARMLSDRVGIMHEGRLIQAGTLDQLNDNPAGPAVKRLLNIPEAACADTQEDVSNLRRRN